MENKEMSTYDIGNGKSVNLILNEGNLTYSLDPNTTEEDRVAFIKAYNEVQKENGLPLLSDDFGKYHTDK